MNVERLHKLRQKDTLIYVYTRLFDFSEKLKAEQTEQVVLEGIREAFYERGLEIPNKSLTFVPFRDTKQDQIIASNKTKIIYGKDLQRLNKCVMLVGFLDGLTKDEGVCFEIGYAYAKGIPVIAVFTDFIQREYKNAPNSTHIVDPVLLAMFSGIVRNYKIVEGEFSFKDRLQMSLDNTFSQLKQKVRQTLLEEISPNHVVNKETVDIYIDIGGGQFEWERMLQQELYAVLSRSGYKTEISKRNFNLVATDDLPIEFGRRDIDVACTAKIVITCADMEEMSSGTAAIQGLARFLKKYIILLNTRTIELVADGGHRMSRNLMIDYSADVVAESYKEVLLLVDEHLKK